MNQVEVTKKCSKCKEVKPIGEFYKDKSKSDKLTSYCKLCCINKELKFRLNNPEIKKQRDKTYRENNHERINEYDKKRYKRTEQRYKVSKEIYTQIYRNKNKLILREKLNLYRRLHGQVVSQQWRYTPEALNWRYKIYEKYNYTCQICYKTHCKIHAHHIKSAKLYPELRYDINNGQCLCENCHKIIHKTHDQLQSHKGILEPNPE